MQHIMTDWEQQIDWAKLRKFRVERMVTVMKQKGIRAVLLAKLDTIRYATSFHSVQTWMFHGNRHIAIVTDEGHVSLLLPAAMSSGSKYDALAHRCGALPVPHDRRVPRSGEEDERAGHYQG